MEFTMKLRKVSSSTKSEETLAAASKIARKRKKSNLACRTCVCTSSQLGVFDFPPVWKELRVNAQLCDGIVKCDDGSEFKIHRAILAAVSPYFKALFTNSINRTQEEATEARVNVTGDIFQSFLDFAYTGTCTITKNNVKHLLQYADQYEILDVVQLCCAFLINDLSPTNCLETLKFASQYFCNELMHKGRLYIRHNFAKLMKESYEFYKISAPHLEDILKDDELNVKNEEAVFEAIKMWIGYSPTRRKIHLFRIPYGVLFAVGGWSAGSPTNFLETYDCRADRWLFSVDTDSSPRAYHGLCHLNGLIYMIGGFDGNEYFNNMRCFDPVQHKWNERSCMYYPRCYVSVTTHKDQIYAMGGYNGRTRMSSVERYSPQKNQWELIAPMQMQRSDASAATVHDKIYIVGGFNGQEVMSSAEVFDIAANQWSYIPQMQSARSGVSLIAFNNTLYAMGGFNGHTRLATGEKFTPDASARWSDIAEMLTPRSNFATVILDDYIFVIGGFNDRFASGSTTINYVEYFDPKSNDWYDAASMNVSRSALSACVLYGLPNAKDYTFLRRNTFEIGPDMAMPQNDEENTTPQLDDNGNPDL
ncbi:unnamed protein product [Acanthoscelides obtectus]|uniref:BTB domain-containing protein n=1 Tax=Acanthoscelides obtectus TaxID=200917 RepID=A0A9P0JT57_ACAOB|nr:unnamed protein product [Acanthoscelides obtectus]CAK1668939.1 Kelch-like protein 10 [Acanthoscelides obtectus]